MNSDRLPKELKKCISKRKVFCTYTNLEENISSFSTESTLAISITGI